MSDFLGISFFAHLSISVCCKFVNSFGSDSLVPIYIFNLFLTFQFYIKHCICFQDLGQTSDDDDSIPSFKMQGKRS